MSLALSLIQLEAYHAESGTLQVVVETPRGSRNKYKYDERRGLFLLHKILPAGAAFPFDFGFVPSTRGEDGDPLDVLLLLPEPVFPGCVSPARLIGVLEAKQTEKGKTVRNDRLIAVPELMFGSPSPTSVKGLGADQMNEIEYFFISYNREEGREFKPIAHRGPKHAERLVAEGMKRFKEKP